MSVYANDTDLEILLRFENNLDDSSPHADNLAETGTVTFAIGDLDITEP